MKSLNFGNESWHRQIAEFCKQSTDVQYKNSHETAVRIPSAHGTIVSFRSCYMLLCHSNLRFIRVMSSLVKSPVQGSLVPFDEVEYEAKSSMPGTAEQKQFVKE